MSRADYTSSTENLIGQIKTLLTQAQSTWNVQIFNGTSQEDLFGMLPGLRAPAALLSYDSSTWENLPRRKATFSVYVMSHNGQSLGNSGTGVSVRSMIDNVVKAIDEQVYQRAFMRVTSDQTIDLGPNTSAARVLITVEDV